MYKYLIKLLLMFNYLQNYIFSIIFNIIGRIVFINHIADKSSNLSLYYWFGLELPDKFKSGMYHLTIYDISGCHHYILNDTWDNIVKVQVQQVDWTSIKRNSMILYKNDTRLKFDTTILDKYVLDGISFGDSFETNMWMITQLLKLDCDKIELIKLMPYTTTILDPKTTSVHDIYKFM